VSSIGFRGDDEYLNIPRLEWGLGMSEKTIRTMLFSGGSERMQRLLRLIQNRRVDPTRLTTHRFTFEEIEKAFRMMAGQEDHIIKPLIVFS